MKNVWLSFLLLALVGMVSSQAKASDLNDHICAREVPTFLGEEYQDPCRTVVSAETVASPELEKEAKLFQTEDIAPIFYDNGSNGHFIAQEGIRRLRRHESCLQKICENWRINCAANNAGNESDQINWCEQKQEELSQIARSELLIVATQNQTRKNRSLLSEKFRQISTRYRYYLHYWVNKTVTNLNFFKGKVDGTTRNPR